MKRGLAVTGGVITAAGIVLAGTFSVLAVLPLVFLTEIGFVIAFGVLLDTFLVRSLLVPALSFELGPRIWWPSTLSSSIERREQRAPTTSRLSRSRAGTLGVIRLVTSQPGDDGRRAGRRRPPSRRRSGTTSPPAGPRSPKRCGPPATRWRSSPRASPGALASS